MDQSIEIQQLLDESPLTTYQWFLFTVCFLAILLDGFDTGIIGYIAPSLIDDWGLSRADLAPVLSAALFGLALGAFLAGPLADRYGRRTVLIASVGIMGAASLASAFSTNLDQLIGWRFIGGLGLGAAMPSSVALMSEFCPSNRRATLTSAAFCGFPVGTAFGGFLAAWMIPAFGWRSVLIFGGVAPLVVAWLALLAPESPRYLLMKHFFKRLHTTLLPISPKIPEGASFVMIEPKSSVNGSGLRLVLSRQYIVGSMMLLTAYFSALIVFYAVVNWMPTLFRDVGITGRNATLISSLFTLGGCGAILLGWLMDRFNANIVLMIGFCVAAVAIYAIGQSVHELAWLVASVFIGGGLLTSSLTSLPALAASFYPTAGRATGIAWMLGLGRFGGIAGSFLVAELSRRQLSFEHIFLIVSLASLASAAAMMVKLFAYHNMKKQAEGPGVSQAELQR